MRRACLQASHFKALTIEFLSPVSLPFLCILLCLPFFGKFLYNFTLGEVSLVCVRVDGIPCKPSTLSSGTQKFNVPAIRTASAIFDSNNITVIRENPCFTYITVDVSSFREINVLARQRHEEGLWFPRVPMLCLCKISHYQRMLESS